MPVEDPARFAATTELDFFALLSLSPQSTAAELRRQYRKTALLYHPDKNPSPEAAEKFQLLQTAYDILNDPTLREIYENAYRGREKRRLEREALGKRRREMISELEEEERGEGKRARLDLELKKLQADGERRRQEKDNALRKSYEEELRSAQLAAEIKADVARTENEAEPAQAADSTADGDLDKSVKVRWLKSVKDEPIHDETTLKDLLAQNGTIDSVAQLKDKRRYSNSLFMFTSVAAAERAAKMKLPSWIKSISLASGKNVLTEPDEISAAPPKGTDYEISTFARLREAAAKQKAKQALKPES
jgi:DnaJ family protein C protein 17